MNQVGLFAGKEEPTYQKRVIKGGFVQYREKEEGGKWGPWAFYVAGFRDDDCRVMLENGYCYVPIDSKNRIKINGKWYDRKFWNH